MNVKRQSRSLIRDFALILTVLLVVVAVVVMVSGSMVSTRSAESELHSKAAERLVELQGLLKIPLWNYSAKEVHLIGEAYLHNDFVATLSIEDAHGEVLYSGQKPGANAVFTLQGPINYHDEMIGTVRFAVSDDYLRELEKSFVWAYFVTALSMLFSTLLLASVALRYFFKRPFMDFIGIVEAYAGGDTHAFEVDPLHDEFKPLIHVLQRMNDAVMSYNEAVKKSEARLHAFFSQAPIGMVIYDADGRHVMVNETLTKVSGIPVQDHIGKTMHELLPKDVADDADAVRRQIMQTGEPVTWELAGVLPGASPHTQYLLNTFFPIPGPDSSIVGVGGGVVDVSALKYTQRELQALNAELEQRVLDRTEALAKEKERAEHFLNIAATMIIALDSDGKITLANRKGCQLLGYSKEELVGRNWFDVAIAYEDKELIRGAFNNLMRGSLEPPEYFESKIITADGERRLISWHNTYIKDAGGSIVGTLSAGTDITEQRATQKSLQEAFELNATIFSNAPVGIAIYDSSGDCISVNGAFGEIIGATRAQVQAQNYHELASWKKSGLYEQAVLVMSSDEKARFEAHLHTTFGKDIVCDCHLVPVVIRDQRHMLLIANDVTELQKVQEQLLQSSKLATLGEMATGVAHELNQPLNVIRLVIGNMQRKLGQGAIDADYLADKLAKLVAQVERSASVIDHMRIFGRRPTGNMVALDACAMMDASLGMIGEQLRLASIDVVSEVEKGLFFYGHQVQVEQVLLNLLANARDELSGSEKAHKQITLRIRAADATTVQIDVEDNGGGIPEDVLPRIFEPFYTTKDIGQGTGLGLSISYGIITDMNGTLKAHNTDSGACFTITLPACLPPSDVAV